MTAQSRAVLGIALTPVLALASAAIGQTPAPTAATAAAAAETRAPGPWGARTLHAANPDPASASGGLYTLVAGGHGTLVSLTGDGLSRFTRVRPVGSTGWLTPRSWPDAGAYNTELVAVGDGSVRLVWRARRADDSQPESGSRTASRPGSNAAI
ncbi:hypothetical protein [Streptomyces sp. NPDC093568]|uniref:hypothetical protein n=1 Tax=Streptomyces sp. NPDC093568 TaxID=3366041 RepID=UPI0037FD9795